MRSDIVIFICLVIAGHLFSLNYNVIGGLTMFYSVLLEN